MTWGQPREGTDNGPSMLREAGLAKELAKLGWQVEDAGDINHVAPSADDPKGDPRHLHNMKNSYAVGKGCQQVYERVAKQAAEGKFVLTLGGDHSIGAGSISLINTHSHTLRVLSQIRGFLCGLVHSTWF